MHVRNQFMGTTLLFCWVQILDFLDLESLWLWLSLFVFGYAMLGASMNQPFGLPSDFVGDDKLNPNNLTQLELFEIKSLEEGLHPIYMFELHFSALFVITGYMDMRVFSRRIYKESDSL